MPKAWRPVFILCPWASTCAHSSVVDHLVDLSPLTLPLPHFPSTVRDCPRLWQLLRHQCQQTCLPFKLKTCLPAFETLYLIYSMVTFREGGGGNLLKISTIHCFLCIRIAEGKFLGGFFPSRLPLQFLLFSLSEGRRMIRSFSKRSQM